MRAVQFVIVLFRCGRRLIVLLVCIAAPVLPVVVLSCCLLFLSFVGVEEHVW